MPESPARGAPDGLWPNGVKLSLHGCKIVCVARRGQQVVAGDRLADRIGIGVLARVFPPELVDRVVDEAGARERRERTLPARVVVYYLLAMVLFFQSGYGEVWNKLVAGLDWARRFQVRLALGMQPSPAAITYARQRLGWQVMASLLEAVAGPLAGQEQASAFTAGMRLVAVDGMCLDLPDTPENGAEFGYPSNDGGRGPFPQIRVVGAGECGTRAVLGAVMSGLATGEQPLTRQLLARLAPGDLLLADRNFLSHGLLREVLDAGIHVLWRAKSDVDLPVLEILADGTYLSRIADPAASRRMRRKGAGPRDIPGIAVRVIEYSVTSAGGGEVSETFTLVTDLLDPAALSPEQAAAAYARRWQLETCFDELETSIRGGAAIVLRSKSPPMIRQEIYAMLCCYQAIRTLISHAAGDAGLDPAQISFTRARDGIRSRISDSGCLSP
jgi:Insertion element 4 transposase N-terminal/Transposase DDE domain